jgi:hypothetical protein
VLAPHGTLIVAIPAADDLIELRGAVQGLRVERNRGNAVVAEHDRLFSEVDRFEIREQKTLEPHALIDLLRITYRGARLSAAGRVDALTARSVTLATEVFLFSPRSGMCG